MRTEFLHVEIPQRDEVFRHIVLCHKQILSHILGSAKVSLIPGEAVCHSEPVESPCLTASPPGLIRDALCGAAAAYLPGLIVIVHDVVAAEIAAEMVLESPVGVADRYVAVGRVACHLAHLEKQLKIHHIVDDDRTFPSPERLPSVVHHIPRLEDAGIGAEARREGSGSVHQNGVISGDMLEPQSIAIAVIDHESHIVMPFEILDVVQNLSVPACVLRPFFLSGQFVHIPERPREEAADPVVCGDILHLPVLECGRYADGVSGLRRFDELSELHFRVADVFIDDVVIGAALQCQERGGCGKEESWSHFHLQ